MYGLLSRHYDGRREGLVDGRWGIFAGRFSTPYTLMLTEKLERLKYWLAINEKLPETVGFEPVESVPQVDHDDPETST